jgi:hypothetical protein
MREKKNTIAIIPRDVLVVIFEFVHHDQWAALLLTSHIARITMSGVLFRMRVRVRSIERIVFWENINGYAHTCNPGCTHVVTISSQKLLAVWNARTIDSFLVSYRKVSPHLHVSLTLVSSPPCTLSSQIRDIIPSLSHLKVRGALPPKYVHLKHIKNVELCDTPYMDDDALSNFSPINLESLSLGIPVLTFGSISSFVNLRYLKLNNNWFGCIRTSRLLVRVIASMPHITHLNLSDNSLSSISLSGIVPMLKTLVLDGNELNAWSLMDLGSSHTNLQSLSLRYASSQGLCVCSVPLYVAMDITGSTMCCTLCTGSNWVT